jgi:5-methylcytosine-specific restriction endonuclease McrA
MFSLASVRHRSSVALPTNQIFSSCSYLHKRVCHHVGTVLLYDIYMPRYDWTAVQKYHDDFHTRNDCIRRFGFSEATWTHAKKRGALRQRPHSFRPEEIETFRHRGRVRRVLLKSDMLKHTCYECGISRWLGEMLSLHLDHINGLANDHRIENLRMLCPNCHSQTSTFAGRNVKRKNG